MTQDVRSDPGGLVPGELLAGYQIQDQIGRGGMAVVYRALDVRLGRVVALKVLAPHLGEDEAFRQRFMRESRAAAGVDHPHIVPVFEAGEADGVLFIAMRYVEHGDVRMLIDTEGRLNPARTTAIAGQVAAALDTAHRYGLVHRDVKPGNILLARASNDADHVYLSDFGLSKHSLAPSTLTSTGQFLGTLDYISPEQIQGHPVDGRADQYALACTIVEMLTGAPPFRRDDSMALMWAQLESEPPRVTQRRPDLPSAVDEVIAAAMAKSPASRYPTCRDFALALRAACAPASRPRIAAAEAPAHWPEQQLAPYPPPRAQPYPEPRQPEPRQPEPRQSEPRQSEPRQAAYPADPFADRDLADPRQVSPGGLWPAADNPVPGRMGAAGQTALDQVQPVSHRLNPWGDASAPRQSPAGGGGGAALQPPAATPPRMRPAQPDTRPSRPGRRRSHRGRDLVLAVIIAVLCLGGIAGIVYALSHRHHGGLPPPAASSPPVSSAGQANPQRVVREYFAAINTQRYPMAYRLSNRSESYADFVAGFAGTARDTVTIVSVSGDVVTARLRARQDDGTVKTYEGTYTVINGAISSSDIHQVR